MKKNESLPSHIRLPTSMVPPTRPGYQQTIMVVWIDGRNEAEIQEKFDAINQAIRNLMTVHPAWTKR